MLIAQMVMVIKKHLAKLVAAAAAVGLAWPAHEHCFGLAIGKKTSKRNSNSSNNTLSQAPLPGLSFP